MRDNSKKENIDMTKTAGDKVAQKYPELQDDTPVLEKRVYMAQKELMNKSESMVDVIINFNNIVKTTADRWEVGYEYMMEWVMGVLPFRKVEVEEEEE